METAAMLQGEVVWFERSFGFVQDTAGQDYFIHYKNIKSCPMEEGEWKRVLKKGQHVTFTIGQNDKGEDMAVDLVVVQS